MRHSPKPLAIPVGVSPGPEKGSVHEIQNTGMRVCGQVADAVEGESGLLTPLTEVGSSPLPTPEEERDFVLRREEAQQAARKEFQAFRSNPEVWVERYYSSPLIRGRNILSLDWILENAECTKKYPGMGPRMGMLDGVRRLGEELGQMIQEHAQKRLDAIPTADRGDWFVDIVIGTPGGGKTTRADLMADQPFSACVIEDVGGDYGRIARLVQRYKRMGFQVEVHAPFLGLEESVARATGRTPRNNRPMPADVLGGHFADTVTALRELVARNEMDELGFGLRIGDSDGTYHKVTCLSELERFHPSLSRDGDRSTTIDVAHELTSRTIGHILESGGEFPLDLLRFYAQSAGGHRTANSYWGIWRDANRAGASQPG